MMEYQGNQHSFSFHDNERDVEITVHDRLQLSEVLECFLQYLKAVGFCFELNDQLIVYNEEEEMRDKQEVRREDI